jgi:alpha-methylacyl-CoA racemase
MSRPLRDVRIVSLATNVPGPVAMSMMRDLGASVIKVEPPGGDPLATISPEWYADLSRGINVMRIDLKINAGRARLEELLSSVDLLVTSSRPAALDRLGLAWRQLHVRHPRLCCVSIVGSPAPRDHVAGHDLTYQAEHGLVDPRSMPRSLVADLGGAQQAVIAALALLVARDRGQAPSCAEVSLADGARFFAEPLVRGLTAPGGPLGGGLSEYNLYRALEGWVAVAALEPHFRAALERELQVDLIDRDAVARVLSTRSAEDWQTWAESKDLPIVAVRPK